MKHLNIFGLDEEPKETTIPNAIVPEDYSAIVKDELDIKSILDVKSFSEIIETKAVNEEIPLLQAISEFSDFYNIDYEDIVKYISPTLKEKLTVEAQEAGMLKRTSSPMYAFK